jgi:hypothetical protein
MPTLTTTGTPTLNGNSTCTIDTTDTVQGPSSVLRQPQGWVAMRVMTPWAGNDGVNHGFFEWGVSGSSIFCGKRNDNLLLFYRKFSPANFGAVSWAANSHHTIICAYDTATLVYLSLDGSNFVTGASTDVPVISQTTFSIGFSSQTPGGVATADYYWFAAGSGTLSNADATTINGFGDNDPLWSAIPGTPTMLWTADSFEFLDAAPAPLPAGMFESQLVPAGWF